MKIRYLLSLMIVLFFIFLAGTKVFIKNDKNTGVMELKETEMKKFSSYDELKEFLKNKVQSSYYGTFERTTAEALPSMAAAEAPSADKSVDYSTTNIQVAGVDEADIVKNDGKYIYMVTGNNVLILNAYPADELRILSKIRFDGTPSEIFINKDKLVIFGNKYPYYSMYTAGIRVREDRKIASPAIVPPEYYSPKAFVYVYDISDRENPKLTRDIVLEGNYVDSRMIGDYVYAIFNSPINDIDKVKLPIIMEDNRNITVQASEIYYFDVVDYSYMFTNILAIDTQNDEKDFTNRMILMGATQNIFASSENIYITYQRYMDLYDFTDRIVEEALIPNLPSEVAGKIEGISKSDSDKYIKMQRIIGELYEYINKLSEEDRKNIQKKIDYEMEELQFKIAREMQKTIVHRISISDGEINYEANGAVPGYILNQFSMDEHDGYFRIATTINNFSPIVIRPMVAEPSFVQTVSAQETEAMPETEIMRASSLNNIYILDSELDIVGSLENLAPNENIYSARFMGDRAYLVTFRRVDPLLVIDLSDPRNPQVLGKLKIPGFSDYLHPYDENHIIGIGKEVQEGDFPLIQGVKLGLFDVSDPSNPREIAKYEIGSRGTDSEALREHKAFLFNKDKNLLVIPILLNEEVISQFGFNYMWQGAYLFDISLENGFKLKGRIDHLSDQKSEYYLFSQNSIRRSLYIDDILYTVSDRMIKANRLNDLNELTRVKLPYDEIQPPVVIY